MNSMELLEIHDRYYERITRFIASLVRDDWAADDLVQEVFIKIDRHIHSLKDREKLGSWIFKIAYHISMDHLKNKHTQLYKQSSELTDQRSGIQLEKKMEQHQMGQCVRQKMELLPDTYRLPLILFDIEGFSHKEISGILGITEENTKIRLHRARKELKKILEKECSFEKDERNVFVCLPKMKVSGR